MLGMALSLASSLCGGGADFIGGLQTRRMPLLTVLLVSQVTALLVAACAVIVSGHAPPSSGAVVYAAVLVGTYLVATPLGGNVSRLNQYAAGPLLACVLWDRRRALLVALAIPLVFWQWFPTFDTIAFSRHDPSTRSA